MTSVSKTSAYPVSVQSGIPRLQDCPDGWTIGPLSEFLYESRRPIKMADEEIYRLVKVKRARGGVVVRENLAGKNISVKSQSEIEAGDFLISKRQIVHGACGLVPSELEGSIVSNEYSVLRGNDGISLNYLNYLAHSVYFQQTCFHSSIGVHVEKMIFKLDRWLSWDFLIPPLAEQKRIAEILSTWDRAIEVVKGLIENSQAQKIALMQQLLTGKKRLPGFDGEWKRTNLGNIAILAAGGTPSTKKADYWGGDILWMSSGEINLRRIFGVGGRITKEGLQNSSARMLPKYSVLIALAGQGKTRGKVAINEIPLTTNQSVAAIIPSDETYYEFLFHNLDSRYDEIRSMSYGDGGRGGLNLSILKSIKIKLPDIDEQKNISKILNAADTQLKLLHAESAKLKSEKSALMQQLLTGKRRVKIDKEAANA